MASFVFVLLLPIGFFAYSLFQNSWQQVEQRMVEKHHLISDALVEPFSLFFSTRQEALKALGQELLSLDEGGKLPAVLGGTQIGSREVRVQRILDKHLNSFGNFIALSYAGDSEGAIECIAQIGGEHDNLQKPDYSKLSLSELPALDENMPGRYFLSPVFESSLSDKPVILMKHHIFDENQQSRGLVYAEISLAQIGKMCSQIKFGVLGHCAVVDNTGHVVAHPNKDWVKTIRNLSKVSIVQKMLAGESGTTEFYSPFLKADMVAGFSPIPSLGWGVMIPQPKAELTQMLDNARIQTTAWLSLGVVIALITAALLTKKIIHPINLLTRLTHKPKEGYDSVDLGAAPAHTPAEIEQLWGSFSSLLAGLQSSNDEVRRLNTSLQEDVEQATAELREKNRQLYETSTRDYLTSLSNRRHFTQYLGKVLRKEIGKHIGIIMIDVDKFKQLNDNYGHEAGDLALKHLATVLKGATRPCDLVARLGGDEFIAYIHEADEAVLTECAERIRRNAEQDLLIMEGKALPFTLSIGTVLLYNPGDLSAKELFRFADQAMYDSKSAGRNRVSSYRTGHVAPETESVLVS